MLFVNCRRVRVVKIKLGVWRFAAVDGYEDTFRIDIPECIPYLRGGSCGLEYSIQVVTCVSSLQRLLADCDLVFVGEPARCAARWHA